MSDNSALNGPGPKNPRFIATLGSLDWAKLSPSTKLDLWRRFQSEESERQTDVPPAKKMRDDLVARYGENYENRMNPAEKVALARAIEKAQTPQPQAPSPGLSPERKLENYHLRQAIAAAEARVQGLRASKGGGFHVESGRAAAIEREEQAIEKMRSRLGGFRS